MTANVDEAVSYAIQVTQVYLQRVAAKKLSLPGLSYLEIGPGNDLAPQLVLASHGADVTVADRFLAEWDPEYHPAFYEAFLDRWSGPADAVRHCLAQGGYDSQLRRIAEPAENMRSIADESFDFVQSNAVLEHVEDLQASVAELARVSRPGGLHCHQIDFRYHTDFTRPLDHLLLPQDEYRTMRATDGGTHGTATRLPEVIELFTKQFWLFDVEINERAEPTYLVETHSRLPADSPYRSWPSDALEPTGACLWLFRKHSSNCGGSK
jgi:SAM-dependent methyltransferase